MQTRFIPTGAAFVLGISLGGVLAEGSAPQPAPAGTMAPVVTGIGGVFFKATDPVQLREWYRRHLGIDTREIGTSFRWRSTDDPAQPGLTVWSIFPRDTSYFGSVDQDVMVNYRVRDLALLLRRLRNAGVRQVGEVRHFPNGQFAWVLDGEGNRLELWQPAP